MNCPSCKAAFDSPLELFDGTLWCPKCKEPFEVGNDLRITPETDRIFHLGDALYNKSLICTDPKERKTMCDKAQTLIKNAAQNGHPHAMLRLGYMYATGYIAVPKTFAVALAKQYYKRVWNGSFNGESVYKYDWLAKAAARLHIELLVQSGSQEELRTIGRALRLKPALAPLLDSVPEMRVSRDDGSGELTHLLEECLNGVKKPLFGLVSMRAGDFVEWADTKTPVSGKRTAGRTVSNIEKYTSSKIVIKCIRNKVVVIDSSNLGLSDWGEKADEEIHIYFFNQNCSPRFRAINRILNRNDATMLLAFLGCTNAVRPNIVICEDDITVCRSRAEPLKHAMGDLKDYLKTGDKNHIKKRRGGKQ